MFYSVRFYLVLIFCICLSCRGDWIEITKRQEKSSSRPSSVIMFPRNAYVYKTTTTPTYEKLSNSPSPTPSVTTEKLVWFSTEEIPLKNITSTTTATSDDVARVTMEDRMDIMDVVTDSTISETLNVSENEEQGKPNLWSSGKSRKGTIVKVDDEHFDNEKSKTEGFIPFLKRVQDDLISNSHKNLRGKINMLKRMRDDLLLSIDERINYLWGRKSSGARHQKDDDYDMHFPSNEGALMTIGFLTFAVFLIKLVLKLVHAIKEKENMMMVMPTMMTTTNAALMGKKKRDTAYAEQNKILQLIEDYTLA